LADFFSSFSREFLSDLENGKPTVELEKALAVVNALGLRLNISDAISDAISADESIKQ
jgi:hypothetical protein